MIFIPWLRVRVIRIFVYRYLLRNRSRAGKPAQPIEIGLSEAILHFGLFFLKPANAGVGPAAIGDHEGYHNFICPGCVIDPHS